MTYLHQFLVCVSSIFCLISGSLQYDPEDNFLIDCGSNSNTSVDNRVFLADYSNSSIISTPKTIFINATFKNSVPASFGSDLYQTARVFNGSSQYNFPIKRPGWHWIRLHFFPFDNDQFNLTAARFSVTAQNFTLLKKFQPLSSPVVKEYSLNVTSASLVLGFIPSANSFAFLNALEVVSLPDELIPGSVEILNQGGSVETLGSRAIETVWRINMGNTAIPPQNDTLSRFWEADGGYILFQNLALFVTNYGVVNYTMGNATENIAPLSVYGTGSKLRSDGDPNTIANVTWSFDVDPGFDYFVRFHFCDIISPPPELPPIFIVFLGSGFAGRSMNLSIYGAPSYMDVLAKTQSNPKLNISIGSVNWANSYSDGILNGLEIMKVSNARGSLDAADGVDSSSASSSSIDAWIIAVSCVGGVLFVMVWILLVFVAWRRRRRRASMVHTSQEHIEEATISGSKMGYRFPFAVVKEATDDFSESLVIGVGGFGKVYKGIFKDGTKVAVKRGGRDQSDQGVAEFRTEIEMLSQFRHRHLVSFIGYCDEKNEMIIIYEYMENGTLKNHLYGGSDVAKLTWRQRLEICIGSAKGLHYLHTGSIKAIIHRDVKSANILLDENLMAKVADFGLSKDGPGIDQTHVSTAVKGSFGYLDPEYLIRQKLTEKSDVHSFGVVMFEVLSGRPVIDPSLPREMSNLVDWALNSSRRGELEQLVDPHLLGDIKPESLIQFVDTAEKCLAEYSADRPTMGEVLWNLEYVLRLQRDNERPRTDNEATNNHSITSVSASHFSIGSIGDLAGVSMSKVFSEMVNAESR